MADKVKGKKTLGSAALWALALLLLPSNIPAASSGVTEAAVKSAYIYNFIQLVDWPERESGPAAGPLRICVIGNPQLGDALAELGDLNISGRGISVSSYPAVSGALGGCHVVVIGREAQDQAAEILKKLGNKDVLTVGDLPQFARKGGMIGFFKENGRVRIELNINASRQAGLKVSAKLIEVARLIR